MSDESSSVFYCAPRCFSLPTVDPEALTVATMLRLAGARYRRHDEAMGRMRLEVPEPAPAPPAPSKKAPKTKYTAFHGQAACVAMLKSSTDLETVQSDQRPALVCVETLTTKCLFPAFTFLTHFDPHLYFNGIKKHVVPLVGGFWERLRGDYRTNILSRNPYFVSGTEVSALPRLGSVSLVAAQKLSEVLADAEEALKALELLHVSQAKADEAFFLGTRRPCVADAYVYSAVSCFLHADLGGVQGSATVAAFQKRLRDECPSLVKYVEKLRLMLFEDYSGTYSLRPVDTPANQEMAAAIALDAMYARGRFRTLVWTGMFAAFYFIVANADMIVALLEEEAEAEQSDAQAAGGEQTPSSPHTVGHTLDPDPRGTYP